MGIIRGGTRQMKLTGELWLREERRKGVERIEVGLSSPAEGGRQKKGAGSVIWVGTGQGHRRNQSEDSREKWEQKWRQLRGGAMGGAM